MFVQLVETGAGQVSGRYEQVVLQADGKISDLNAGVTGAVSGDTIVIAIKPNGWLTEAFTASGTISNGVVRLSSGASQGSLNAVFTKSGETEFRTEVARLRTEADRLQAARSEQESVQHQAQLEFEAAHRAEAVSSEIREFLARWNVPEERFSALERRFEDATIRMQNLLAREEAVYGGFQASVARSQLSVVINQLSIDANGAHISLNSSRQTFEFAATGIRRSWGEASSACTGLSNSACHTAIVAFGGFDDRYQALKRQFDHAEAVWNRERLKQEVIVKAAYSATR